MEKISINPYIVLSIVAIVAIVSIGTAALVTVHKNNQESYQMSNVGLAVGGINKNTDPYPENPGKSPWEIVKMMNLQGEHYNLNIHAKKPGYTNCDVGTDPETGLPDYGNVINTLIDSNDESILFLSGNKLGKKATTTDMSYGVLDPCTEGFDNDAAEVRLPPNDNGYFVVAKPVGTPKDMPDLTLEGELAFVLDENGTDLFYLGLVTDDGFSTTTETFTRTKGKQYAIDITGMFEWSGDVCYFNPEIYCFVDGVNICSELSTCCRDTNGDGIFDECVDTVLDAAGFDTCPIGYSLETVFCNEYIDEWVFNIGDFVGYLWNLQGNGDIKLNVRFYPIPDTCQADKDCAKGYSCIEGYCIEQ